MTIKKTIFKWVAIACFLCIFIMLLAAARIAMWLTSPDLAARVQQTLTHSLGRKVTLSSLQIQLDHPLVLSVSDLHVANASWGSEPDMMRIGHMTAELELSTLLKGQLKYKQLTIDDFDMLLERDKNGTGNWRMSDTPKPTHQPQANGGIAVIPKNRTQFPVLMNMQLRRGLLRLRTSSGQMLRIAADHFAMGADGDNAPMRLSWQGSYNGTLAQLNADMESYAVLRDGSRPYKTHVTIDLAHSKLDYVGTMMNPLDADGLDGQLQITSSQLGEVLQMMGMQQPSSLALNISGPFTRQGDHWRWNNTADHLADNNFKGDLALDEGARGKPDTIGLNLAAGKFDLKSVWAGISAGPKMQSTTFEDTTNLFLNLRLRAQELLYGSIHVFDAAGKLTIQPGEVALEPSTFTYIGGKATAAGKISAQNNNLQFSANANVMDGDMTVLAKTLGAGGVVTGRFDIAASLNMSGKILDKALQQNSVGGMVFAVHQGEIQKDILEKTSVDLRTLLRRNDGQVPIQCMLATLNIHNGIGKISPLKLITANGNVLGGGQVDLVHQRLDMIIKSDPDTTSFFALDIPIRVSGPFTNMGVVPALSSDVAGVDLENSAIPTTLPPQLRTWAQQNNCLK